MLVSIILFHFIFGLFSIFIYVFTACLFFFDFFFFYLFYSFFTWLFSYFKIFINTCENLLHPKYILFAIIFSKNFNFHLLYRFLTLSALIYILCVPFEFISGELNSSVLLFIKNCHVLVPVSCLSLISSSYLLDFIRKFIHFLPLYISLLPLVTSSKCSSDFLRFSIKALPSRISHKQIHSLLFIVIQQNVKHLLTRLAKINFRA